MLKSLDEGMQGTVQFEGAMSKKFNLNCGVKQGCVLAPTLFGIFFSALLDFAFINNDTFVDSVYVRTRPDGDLFNLSRLRAKRKTRQVLVRELLFADDAALVSHSIDGLQKLMDAFEYACREFSLIISIKKTVVLHQTKVDGPIEPITVENNPLEAVDTFTYLGSAISKDLTIDR